MGARSCRSKSQASQRDPFRRWAVIYVPTPKCCLHRRHIPIITGTSFGHGARVFAKAIMFRMSRQGHMVHTAVVLVRQQLTGCGGAGVAGSRPSGCRRRSRPAHGNIISQTVSWGSYAFLSSAVTPFYAYTDTPQTGNRQLRARLGTNKVAVLRFLRV